MLSSQVPYGQITRGHFVAEFNHLRLPSPHVLTRGWFASVANKVKESGRREDDAEGVAVVVHGLKLLFFDDDRPPTSVGSIANKELRRS
ncbi:hypothetical protein QYF36_005916 [Acer negundo]|nr:hypothetical protein QYF36_005916 [Acer negundo]